MKNLMINFILGFAFSLSAMANNKVTKIECVFGDLTPTELSKRVMMPYEEFTVKATKSPLTFEISGYDNYKEKAINFSISAFNFFPDLASNLIPIGSYTVSGPTEFRAVFVSIKDDGSTLFKVRKNCTECSGKFIEFNYTCEE